MLRRGDKGASLFTNLLSKTLSKLFQNTVPASNHTLQQPVPKFTFCYFKINKEINENLLFLLSQSPASFTECSSSPYVSFSESLFALTSFSTSGDALDTFCCLSTQLSSASVSSTSSITFAASPCTFYHLLSEMPGLIQNWQKTKARRFKTFSL